MKSFVKIVSLILIIILALCACQSENGEVIPEYGSDITVERDLNGFSVRWGFAKSLNNEDNILGFVPGTAFADLALERKKDIEKRYNCTLEMTYKDLVSNIDDNLYSTMSGDSLYDILTNESIKLINHIRAGYIYPLSGFLDIADTEKWGEPNMLLSLMWNNDLYGVLPYAWPELLYTSFGYPIVVNENLISQYGHEDPREFVENNTWTWDKFEEVLLEYTHKDGEKAIYGMGTHGPYYAMMMFLSNGVGVSSYQDGQVVAGAYTEQGTEALERAKKIYTETCRDCFHPDSSTGGCLEAFKAGECVLVTTHSNYSGGIMGHSDSLVYVMDNIGILPYPLGPHATPGVYKGYHESMYFATSIPVLSRDPEIAALIIDATFEPFEGFETKESIIEYMTKQIFFDERDTRVFVNILKNTEYGFFNEGARSLIAEAVTGSSPVSTVQQSNKNQYDKIVEDYMVNHYNSIISLFGEQNK